MSDVKTKEVTVKFGKIKAPHSWAGDQWQFAGCPPLRFDENAVAEIIIEFDGEPVTIDISGPDGVSSVPVLDFIVARQADFSKSGNPRSEKRTVGAE